MKLIDADALILHLNDYALTESPNDNETTEERRMSEMVYRVIHNCIKAVEEQPTAYDPVAVVAKLEEYKDSHLVEHDSERYEHCKEEEINCDGRDCFLCVWDKAIEIVRKGGV